MSLQAHAVGPGFDETRRATTALHLGGCTALLDQNGGAIEHGLGLPPIQRNAFAQKHQAGLQYLHATLQHDQIMGGIQPGLIGPQFQALPPDTHTAGELQHPVGRSMHKSFGLDGETTRRDQKAREHLCGWFLSYREAWHQDKEEQQQEHRTAGPREVQMRTKHLIAGVRN